MSNLRLIHRPAVADPDVVDLLERALGAARAGELRAVVLCEAYADRVYDVNAAGDGDVVRALGMLEVAKAELLARNAADDDAG